MTAQLRGGAVIGVYFVICRILPYAFASVAGSSAGGEDGEEVAVWRMRLREYGGGEGGE